MSKNPEEPRMPEGRPITMAGPVGELARIMGGKSQVARAVGVDGSTIFRWAQEGRCRSKPALILLAQLFVQYSVSDGVEAFLKASATLPRGITRKKGEA